MTKKELAFVLASLGALVGLFLIHPAIFIVVCLGLAMLLYLNG